MNSSRDSLPESRRIASNRLWSSAGIVRNPVVTISREGRIVELRTLENPDREPLTEFYSGVLVCNFPVDYRAAFDAMMARRDVPLDALLRGAVSADGGSVVVISGIDYERFMLTEKSRIQKV